MSQIVSIHSFRGGAGKSSIRANVAALMALDGKRVGIVDTDVQSPGIHSMFGPDEDHVTYALSDYLSGRCAISQTAHDVSAGLGPDLPGAVFVIPSSRTAGEITRALDGELAVALLNDALRRLIREVQLDALIIDTYPGLYEETVLFMALSDALAIILRLDQQDYQATGVTVEVARKLGVPRLCLILNKVPAVFDQDEVRTRVEHTYGCAVAAVLPYCDELAALGSAGIFAQRYPHHPMTAALQALAGALGERRSRALGQALRALVGREPSRRAAPVPRLGGVAS
jgi:MinD-like ATPase involved in chromosome partitioning or flagellar assembly